MRLNLTFSHRAGRLLVARHSVADIVAQDLPEGGFTKFVRHRPHNEVLIAYRARLVVASIVPAAIASLGLVPGSAVCIVRRRCTNPI